MKNTPLHNPDRHMIDLRQILSQGRKRVGILIGAGAPTAIRVNENNEIVADNGDPLIPDVAGLTEAVVSALDETDQKIIRTLQSETADIVNVESILTRARRLSEAIAASTVHGLDGPAYGNLAQRICDAIGDAVNSRLPASSNPYSELVSWIAGTHREHSVELFTPNYDLLMEEAFERARVPYFDGFTGSHMPFFDSASVSSDVLPARWALLWKLHGSLGWKISGDSVVRTGRRDTTELIYPEYLKYDQVGRLPYSALFERLRSFLMSPDTLLICSGFSFRDFHIRAVLDEALAANAHTALLAFQYGMLTEESPAADLAFSRPNMSVYASDGAIVNGVQGSWQPEPIQTPEWAHIRQTFWNHTAQHEQEQFLLGDFAKLAQFLALTQAQQISSSLPAELQGGEQVGERARHPGTTRA